MAGDNTSVSLDRPVSLTNIVSFTDRKADLSAKIIFYQDWAKKLTPKLGVTDHRKVDLLIKKLVVSAEQLNTAEARNDFYKVSQPSTWVNLDVYVAPIPSPSQVLPGTKSYAPDNDDPYLRLKLLDQILMKDLIHEITIDPYELGRLYRKHLDLYIALGLPLRKN